MSIEKVKTQSGKTFKSREIAFFLRDDTGYEWYVGRVAVIGDYLYVPGTSETRKENGEVRVIVQSPRK